MKLIKPPHENELSSNEPKLSILMPQDGLLLNHLATNFRNTKTFILSLPTTKLLYKYSEDKWTIKEIIAHLIDMERIYTYRMLTLARNDNPILSSFDDHQYVLQSNANNRNIEDLINELNAVRESTITLLKGFTDEALLRSGNIRGNQVTVRALAYHIGGHEIHHMNIIKERYLHD